MGCANSKPTVVEVDKKPEHRVESAEMAGEAKDVVPPLKKEKKKSKRISLYGRAKRLRRKGVSAESEQKRKERKVGSIVFEEEDLPLQTYEKDEETIKTMEAALKNHFLFANMTDALLRDLVMCFEREEFLAEDVILEQGAESTKEDKMYLVSEGEVEIFLGTATGPVQFSVPGPANQNDARFGTSVAAAVRTAIAAAVGATITAAVGSAVTAAAFFAVGLLWVVASVGSCRALAE